MEESHDTYGGVMWGSHVTHLEESHHTYMEKSSCCHILITVCDQVFHKIWAVTLCAKIQQAASSLFEFYNELVRSWRPSIIDPRYCSWRNSAGAWMHDPSTDLDTGISPSCARRPPSVPRFATLRGQWAEARDRDCREGVMGANATLPAAISRSALHGEQKHASKEDWLVRGETATGKRKGRTCSGTGRWVSGKKNDVQIPACYSHSQVHCV